MKSFNKVILEGAVGAHRIEFGETWSGQFDLHVEMGENTIMVFDCRATESGLVKLDGIGGHDVRVEGRIMIHQGGQLDKMPFVEVEKLEII